MANFSHYDHHALFNPRARTASKLTDWIFYRVASLSTSPWRSARSESLTDPEAVALILFRPSSPVHLASAARKCVRIPRGDPSANPGRYTRQALVFHSPRQESYTMRQTRLARHTVPAFQGLCLGGSRSIAESYTMRQTRLARHTVPAFQGLCLGGSRSIASSQYVYADDVRVVVAVGRRVVSTSGRLEAHGPRKVGDQDFSLCAPSPWRILLQNTGDLGFVGPEKTQSWLVPSCQV
ncbi:hypothetical protein EGW08_006297 [Elysia chlorotica]|uniref:Uncharacterized protein n=1 Tax=Elysia chlorotica TaxID=188477 RepID=A0A3S1A9C1_ELYCH|nr:hypothetical protein EGW08_006297 [Elysia chlorotica]